VATTRAHAVSDVGLARSTNQDSGYAGRHLFLVADGMGGHAGGDVASAIALRHLVTLDREYASAGEAEMTLREGFVVAARALADAVAERSELTGMGTTVSGIALAGGSVVVAHIGDSRVYRFRDGKLEQMTSDHTFVQRLVETGRISAEEAAHHPKRSVLMRVLGDVDVVPDVDTAIHDTRHGDRWLMCSDGLSSYVDDEEIAAILGERLPTESTTAALLKASLDAGAPDNVTIVLLDIGDEREALSEPITVGSAAGAEQYSSAATRRQPRLPSLLLHPLKPTVVEDSHYEPEADEYLDALIAEHRRRVIRRRVTAIVAVVLAAAALVAAVVLGYQYTQTQYYVGEYNGRVALYQGVNAELGPLRLSHMIRVTNIELEDLPDWRRARVEASIPAPDVDRAEAILEELNDAAQR